ncbi:hypothetical protein [Brevibacillus massiliensis]|uniref:hypothetical protein n=1 Tax=Brevibacillus massiliensis TaxID=1118054 RepID=UPI00036179C0|nr:hypothetical protein [Brevibacillus massiliensis]
MITSLLVWLLAAYGCASLLVALLERISFESLVRASEPLTHYKVLLYNSDHSLEGVIRRLIWSSIRYGQPIRISFVDFGSTDDTLKIATTFERNYEYLVEESERDKTNTILIDLRRPTEQESM